MKKHEFKDIKNYITIGRDEISNVCLTNDKYVSNL